MQFLSRIPVSGWFVIFLIYCYGLRNPFGYDVWHFVLNGQHDVSSRVVIGLLMTALFGMVVYETHNSFGHWGLLMFVAIVGSGFWFLHDQGLFSAHSLNSILWWGPILMAFTMTLGFQGGRIYRSLTGRQPVAVDQHHAADIPPSGHHL